MKGVITDGQCEVDEMLGDNSSEHLLKAWSAASVTL